MRLSELLDGLEVGGALDRDPQITDIAYDSRGVAPGDLFVAVPGFHTDGRRFIPEALARGAASVVAEEEEGWAFPQDETPIERVPSARAALARLAANFYGHPVRKLPRWNFVSATTY